MNTDGIYFKLILCIIINTFNSILIKKYYFPLFLQFKYAKISSRVNNSVKKGVVFATYSSLIGESHNVGKYKTRFKQLIQWFGKDFDGVVSGSFNDCVMVLQLS